MKRNQKCERDEKKKKTFFGSFWWDFLKNWMNHFYGSTDEESVVHLRQ